MSTATTFGPCRFCSDSGYSLSSAGPNVCPRCDTAISIIGKRPTGISEDDYRALILEVAAVADQVPQKPGEKFPAWRERAALALQVVRAGKPLPPHLLMPLSAATLAAIKDGKSISQILLIASTPPAKPAPVVAVKARADIDPRRKR